MEGTMLSVLQILAIFSPLLCSCEQAIPLVAWSNTRSLANTPRISAGKLVTREELGTSYMDSILQTHPQNIFLFVFDELSIGDISKYSDAYRSNGQGGALSHLKNAMEKSSSHLVLPTVESGDLEDDLSSKVNGATINLKEPTLEGVTLDLTKTNLIVTHLSVASSDSKEEAFARADGIINSVIEDQTTRSVRYTAILTSKEKAKMAPAEADRLTVGRRLLQDVDPGFTAHYKEKDCNVYLTATTISLATSVSSTTKFVELPTKLSDWSTSGTCADSGNEVTLVVSLQTKFPPDLTNFTMSLSFSKDFQYWNLMPSSFVEMAKTEKGAQKYNLKTTIDDTPNTFSYHCSNGIFRLLPQGGGRGEARLKFTELQVQPFGIKANGDKVDQFGPANDCVGFFTEGIWMGLFMGLILLIIFSFGMGMLANLRVMDKFDDPKGKTISVNAGE